VAILALLAVLAVRAEAGTRGEDPEETADSPAAGTWGDIDDDGGEPAPRSARTTYALVGDAALQRIVTSAPPVDAVVAAAYRAAGIAGNPAPSWRMRSRLSALVPWIAVRAGQNDAWRDVEDPTISHSLVFDVRAAWHLDRLVFDPTELRISAHDIARRRERRRLATHAIHVYFDWVAAASAAAEHDIRAVLDADEKRAELDALTAGWFSQALAKGAQTQ
jgi:hypothetical protein